MKQKAQSEIVGLVVIVIIISFVLLFYVSASISNSGSKKPLFRQYTNNDLSASFTKALIDTTVCGTTLDTLIFDCATSKQMTCDDGMNSCQKINDTLINITNQTLNQWGYIYDIVITMPDEDDNILVGTGECNSGTVGRSPLSPYSIPLYPWSGTARIELGICN